MGFIKRFRNFFNRSPTITRYQMMEDRGNGFFEFDGTLYQSDIIRACIRPKVKAIGKLVGKHIRETFDGNSKEVIAVNPDVNIRFLLEEPNPFMTGQMMQEKLATQLCLNNNAFAVIIRDDNGLPMEIYPVYATGVEAIYNQNMDLSLRFTFSNGRQATFLYSDVIHLRQDFYENDIFGTSPALALIPLMNVISSIDKSIVSAIKNSSVVRWLLKFTSNMRPEDLKTQAKDFADNFLETEKGTGVAAIDVKTDATQIQPNNYVPNAAQMDRTVDRIYSFFNTNKKIVQSDYNEDEWTAYFESEIEPPERNLSEEYTRKIFSRKQRGFGNRIYFEASNLQYASMQTKLAMQAMVDRGAMTPNEWRSVINMAPIDGGDTPVRRLDTAPINN
ncbi:phage portal protein [Caproicibacterium sp. BJN0003]|uniref:phage portal protein n=1 Tax=Caproicibacterium sp. BJN0003 TaxID=2994078 RepID=UPI00224F64C8|nr:phage portal protein [Caproicibacterium sp. BJN0003]UZT82139.1 phage portal protein [Caproicibacterium sp. BJN0003]